MMYNEQIEKQVIGRLKVDNPWWTEGAVPDFFRDMSPRLYLDHCCPVNFQTAEKSIPKPFRIGLRAFFFKKQAP